MPTSTTKTTTPSGKIDASLKATDLALRAIAIAYPDATEDFPWGHRAIKVKGKMFVITAIEGGELTLSVKLPSSSPGALALPFTAPTGYGMGKAGWVTSTFKPNDVVPMGFLREWIDESYRAVAPKTLVKRLDGGGTIVARAEPANGKTAVKKTVQKTARKTAKKTAKKPGKKKARATKRAR